MCEFRILDYNYFFDSQTNLTASSEATGLPVTNLNSHQRSKVWRSSGNYVVDSTNNKIDFNDGSGNVVATISSGTYSATDLGTEIKTQLDASGSLTHTVTYDTATGLWTIAASGTFSLLWNTGANLANTAAGLVGFSTASDSTGAATYTGSIISIHTEEWVLADLITTENIDSIGIIFDKTDGINLSNSAVVKVQANATNSWSSPSVNVTLTADTTYDCFTYRWASAQAYRYWRILITDSANANLYVEIGNIILSYATQLTQVPSNGFELSLSDLSKKTENDYGNQFFDIYPSRRSVKFNHIAMSEADVETLYTIYDTVGVVTPIVLWLDPAATIYDKDRFFIYGRLKGDFKSTQNFYTYFDQELELVEAI